MVLRTDSSVPEHPADRGGRLSAVADSEAISPGRVRRNIMLGSNGYMSSWAETPSMTSSMCGGSRNGRLGEARRPRCALRAEETGLGAERVPVRSDDRLGAGAALWDPAYW